MPVFRYKARSPRGDAVQGRLEAPNADAVANQLINSGITPIDIAEAPVQAELLATLRRRLASHKPTLDDLILFSRQMYGLMRAGIPIIRALNGLADNIHNPLFVTVLRDVIASLESGRDLSSALGRHPDTFNNLFISIIHIGETTGRLDEAFLQLAHYQGQEKHLRDQVKAALRYPLTVIIAITIAVGIINVYVIPQFANMFSSFHATLPLPTRILMMTSRFTTQYWYLILSAVAALIAATSFYLRTEGGRYHWDKAKLRLPLIGSILLRATLARFARAFTMAARAGVPIVQTLSVVSRAVNNAYVGDRLLSMRNGVERGDNLTRTAAATGLFTPLVLQMFAVGEETGNVDDMLEQVADFYEREVDYDLARLSSAIEPILIVVIGGIVLVLMLGVFLPLWDMAAVSGG